MNVRIFTGYSIWTYYHMVYPMGGRVGYLHVILGHQRDVPKCHINWISKSIMWFGFKSGLDRGILGKW